MERNGGMVANKSGKAKRFQLSSFPQYVSRVQNKMAELKHQSFANSRKYDIAPSQYSQKRRSPLNLSCFDTEASPSNVRRRPLPRNLSPLTFKRGEETEGGKNQRSGGVNTKGEGHVSPFMHSWGHTKQPIVSPKNPWLSLPLQPLPGVSIQGLFSPSSGSSDSGHSFPGSTTAPSPSTFHVLSKLSISSNEQSPPVRKRSAANPLLAVSPNPLHKSSSLPQLRLKRNSSLSKPNVPSASRTPARSPVCNQSPYLMPITRLKPEVRPIKNKGKRKHRRQQQQHSREMNSDSSTDSYSTVSENEFKHDKSPVGNWSMWNPAKSMDTSIKEDDIPQNAITDSTTPATNTMLTIPTITIRSATPQKIPNEEETSLVSTLTEKFVLREELVQELDQLKEDLKMIAEANDAIVVINGDS